MTNRASRISHSVATFAFIFVLVGFFVPSLDAQTPGSIVGWGSEIGLPPYKLQNVVAISASRNHNLALTSYGSIMAWGDNQYGQCNVPSPNSDFIAVSAGVNFSLGLK